ncbi:MAG: hypothetical protein NW201_12920 [Gemmatimonadales bacterium]|nr:hypothetical protein [Gemmatimonadales bacterium]
MLIRRLLLALGAALAMPPPGASAQWRAEAEAGGAVLRQDGLADARAFTLGLRAFRETGRRSLGGSAVAALGTEGGWSTFTQVAAIERTTPGPLEGELAVAGSLFGLRDGGLVPTLAMRPRLLAFRGDWGLGASFEGVVRQQFGRWSSAAALEGGGWRLLGRWRVEGTARVVFTEEGIFRVRRIASPTPPITPGGPQPVDDGEQPIPAPGPGIFAVDTLFGPRRYGEVEATARWAHAGAELVLQAGLRRELDPGERWRPYAGATGTLPLTGRWAVVASASRRLDEPARGLPAASVGSLGVRVALGPGAEEARAPAGARVDLARRDGARRLRVRGVDGATRVRLRASFLAWEAVDLVREAGAWWMPASVPSGAHRIAVQVDDGAWVAPAGLSREADEFDGEVGLLVVP